MTILFWSFFKVREKKFLPAKARTPSAGEGAGTGSRQMFSMNSEMKCRATPTQVDQLR